ncbi:large conductance mechanosensitive channel protein MscL [Kluyvera georgiana]|uniref:large conductance mechanosensitive channel protein MscL n=1 Tax=Kluyvera georgiana TaxID=73098 RepID=UPI002EB08CAA|nr:large conductance mechanosensitive channel protein MscL [Peptococcaceae bacterium]
MSGKIKNFIEEFKAFALRGNMMDMAVGIIIGGAFTGIVTSLTDNFINPILNFVTGAETYTLQNVAGFASSFVSELVNFFIMAFVLFLLLKGMNKLVALGKKPEAPAAPTTKVCPFCQSEIAINATRCPHCTSELTEPAPAAPVAAQ